MADVVPISEFERLRRELGEAREENAALKQRLEERSTADKSLLESEGRYRAVVDALHDGIVIHGVDGSIIAWNRSAEEVLGLTGEQLQGRTSLDPRWRCVREDGSPFPGAEHPAMKTLETGESFRGVIMGVHTPEGELRWLSVNSQPASRGGSSRYAVVASFSDITKQVNSARAMRASEETLRHMLSDKETLLRELHHRTRNNMALIRSILALRSYSSPAKELGHILSEVDERIRAMELVHQKLYLGEDLGQVELADYLGNLVDLIRESHGLDSRNIAIETQLSPVWCSLDIATPFGLIVVEAFTNALRHAFPDGRAGTVRIRLSELEGGEIELTVADDGVGWQEDGPAVRQGIGVETMRQLTEHQLQGHFDIGGKGGVQVRCRFDKGIYDQQGAGA